MKFVTLGFKEDGSTVLLAGVEVAPAEQRRAVDDYRRDGLPDGIVKVEIWQRTKTKVAVRPTVAPAEGAEPEATESPEDPATEQPKESKAPKGKRAPAGKPSADPFE